MQYADGGSAPRARAPWILVPAVISLMTFYYLARADTIGVTSTGHAWVAMTRSGLPAWAHYLAAVLLLGVIPVAIACLVTRRSPADLGLGIGRWREGLAWVAVGVPLAVVAGRIAAGDPAMRAVYPLYPRVLTGPGGFWGYAALQFLYYAGWETLFRGVLLHGLADSLGDRPANIVQTGLSVTAHFGRALPETASALPAGLVFGAVALRTRSIWYVVLIHWTVGISMDWFIVHATWG